MDDGGVAFDDAKDDVGVNSSSMMSATAILMLRLMSMMMTIVRMLMMLLMTLMTWNA